MTLAKSLTSDSLLGLFIFIRLPIYLYDTVKISVFNFVALDQRAKYHIRRLTIEKLYGESRTPCTASEYPAIIGDNRSSRMTKTNRRAKRRQVDGAINKSNTYATDLCNHWSRS